jgi:hypothetical protein
MNINADLSDDDLSSAYDTDTLLAHDLGSGGLTRLQQGACGVAGSGRTGGEYDERYPQKSSNSMTEDLPAADIL